MEKRVARIFLDLDGWHISDNKLTFLDSRNQAFRSKKAAIESLVWAAGGAGEFTHYLNGRGQEVKIEVI